MFEVVMRQSIVRHLLSYSTYAYVGYIILIIGIGGMLSLAVFLGAISILNISGHKLQNTKTMKLVLLATLPILIFGGICVAVGLVYKPVSLHLPAGLRPIPFFTAIVFVFTRIQTIFNLFPWFIKY